MNTQNQDTAVTFTPRDPRAIVRTPEVCGGKPRLDGTRIRVQDVYIWHELEGKSPDEIVHAYPRLSMADVYAALSFFWAHRAEILDQVDQERRRYESRKRTEPSLLADRVASLGQSDAADDSLSS